MDLPESLLASSIRRGTIIHAEIFEQIGHGKFFVVMAVTEDSIVGFFFINSNINPILEDKPEQMNMQFLLKMTDYAFLKYDSYLCASSLIKRKREDLTQALSIGKAEIVGELKECDMNLVLHGAQQSRLFSKNEKEQFFYP